MAPARYPPAPALPHLDSLPSNPSTPSATPPPPLQLDSSALEGLDASDPLTRTRRPCAAGASYYALYRGAPAVVLRVPIPPRAPRPAVVAFARAAVRAAAAPHPALVPVVAVGEEPNGDAALVVSAAPADTPLRDALLAMRRAHRVPSLRTVVAAAAQVASGLRALHTRHVPHGDLSPLSIVLANPHPDDGGLPDDTVDPGVMLADYGLALPVAELQRAAAEAAPPPKDGDDALAGAAQLWLSASGASATTTSFAYTPPEAAAAHASAGAGRAAGRLHAADDPALNRLRLALAADVYAFAIVLYEMLTLRPPYPDLNMIAVRAMVVSRGERPTWPEDDTDPHEPDAPQRAALRALVARMWAQDPAERPDIRTVCVELEHVLNTLPPAGAAPRAGTPANGASLRLGPCSPEPDDEERYMDDDTGAGRREAPAAPAFTSVAQMQKSLAKRMRERHNRNNENSGAGSAKPPRQAPLPPAARPLPGPSSSASDDKAAALLVQLGGGPVDLTAPPRAPPFPSPLMSAMSPLTTDTEARPTPTLANMGPRTSSADNPSGGESSADDVQRSEADFAAMPAPTPATAGALSTMRFDWDNSGKPMLSGSAKEPEPMLAPSVYADRPDHVPLEDDHSGQAKRRSDLSDPPSAASGGRDSGPSIPSDRGSVSSPLFKSDIGLMDTAEWNAYKRPLVKALGLHALDQSVEQNSDAEDGRDVFLEASGGSAPSRDGSHVGGASLSGSGPQSLNPDGSAPSDGVRQKRIGRRLQELVFEAGVAAERGKGHRWGRDMPPQRRRQLARAQAAKSFTSADSNDIVSRVSEAEKVLDSACVLEIMQAHRQNVVVARACVATIDTIAKHEEKFLDAVEEGALDELVGAVSRFERDAVLCSSFCKAMRSFSAWFDDRIGHLIRAVGVPMTLVSLVDRHKDSIDVQVEGCRAIAAVCGTSESNRSACAALRGPFVVHAALTRSLTFWHNADLARASLEAFSCIADNNEEAAEAFIHVYALDTISRSAEVFSNEDMEDDILAALESVGFYEQGRLAVIKANGIKAVSTIMLRKDDPVFVQRCCRFVATICEVRLPCCEQEMLTSMITEGIVNALSSVRSTGGTETAKLVFEAAQALAFLASFGPAMQNQCELVGALDAVFHAFNAQMSNPKCVKMCSRALIKLLEKNRHSITVANGLGVRGALVRALEKHRNDEPCAREIEAALLLFPVCVRENGRAGPGGGGVRSRETGDTGKRGGGLRERFGLKPGRIKGGNRHRGPPQPPPRPRESAPEPPPLLDVPAGPAFQAVPQCPSPTTSLHQLNQLSQFNYSRRPRAA